MDQDQDGEVSPYMIRATCKQMGVTDDLMQARLKRLLAQETDCVTALVENMPLLTTSQYMKMRQIIANMYQVAGAHDCPEHILDVLADPEDATDEQIEAMLPYHIIEPAVIEAPMIGGERAHFESLIAKFPPRSMQDAEDYFVFGIQHQMSKGQSPLPRVCGVSRDAESPGGKSILVSFDRELSDDELRRLHDILAARES